MTASRFEEENANPGDFLTPMIDVVFQLIVFFLFTLRFRSLDRRIESELPRDGPCPSPVFVNEPPTVKVACFRVDPAGPRPFTRLRLGARTVDLPPVPEFDRGARADVVQAVRDLEARLGDPPAVKGEIRTPPPFGPAVPHGDVVFVLDALLEAGIADVTFEGSPLPLPAPPPPARR